MRWPSKMNSHGLNNALFPLLPSLQMIDLYFISSKPVPKDHLHSYTWYLVLSNDPPVTKRSHRQRTEGWAAIQPSIQGYFTARVSLPVRIEWKTWLIVTFMTHCRFPSNLWTPHSPHVCTSPPIYSLPVTSFGGISHVTEQRRQSVLRIVSINE